MLSMITFVEFSEIDNSQHVSVFDTISNFKHWFKRFTFNKMSYVIIIGNRYFYHYDEFIKAIEE